MDKKGEGNINVLIMIFVGVIVALVLYQAAAGFIGQTTNTATMINGTYTMPAVGSTTDLVGQELLDTPLVQNRSGSNVVPTTNYTIAETVSRVDGLKRISITTLNGPWASRSVNISYGYGPEGYIDDSGGRAIMPLILILGAIAIAIFVLVPTFRNGIIDMIGG